LVYKGYRGSDFFDWLYEEVQTLRVMPSDGSTDGHSAISRARQQAESNFFEPLAPVLRPDLCPVLARALWTSLLLKVLHFNLERAGIVSQSADSTRD
jgi:hypothetical protein